MKKCSKTEKKLCALRGREGEVQLATDPGRRPTDEAEYAYSDSAVASRV